VAEGVRVEEVRVQEDVVMGVEVVREVEREE
jgi:hypothetical protein